MLAGPILAAFCTAVCVVTSLMTKAPDPERIRDVCWEHPLEFLRQGRVTGAGDPRIVALVLLVVMVSLYCAMR
jgi:hypothetical protein